MSERVAIIGGGKIGEALLAGLIRSGKPIKDLVVVERFEARRTELAGEYGIRVTDDVRDAAESAQIVVIAVKPDGVEDVLRELARADDSGETERITITVVAGIPTARYEAALPAGAPVIRAMPNTPMLVNEAMTAVSPGRYATDEQTATAVTLMETVGRVMVVPEKQMDAVTALSGSGPAYFYLMVEALIDAGVGLGLTRAQAAELAGQTLRGSGLLLSESGVSPVEARAAVTSPAGTTAAALRELERYGLRHAVGEAARAAAQTSQAAARRVEVETSRPGQPVPGELGLDDA